MKITQLNYEFDIGVHEDGNSFLYIYLCSHKDIIIGVTLDS